MKRQFLAISDGPKMSRFERNSLDFDDLQTRDWIQILQNRDAAVINLRVFYEYGYTSPQNYFDIHYEIIVSSFGKNSSQMTLTGDNPEWII